MRNLRLILISVLVVLAIVLAAARPAGAATKAEAPSDAGYARAIRHYRMTTLELRVVMGVPTRFPALGRVSLRRARRIWRHRAVAATRVFRRGPAHEGAWLCIHRYEGAWSDGGSPYYGGLQMDIGFQETYGRALFAAKGTADHWTPLEQMWVAERAYRSGRGFYPWPNTARYCGLV
jgi:hypothetical protein